MKKYFYFLFLLVAYQNVQAKDKPNVIVIMADDISAKEFEIYNATSHIGERAKTPVIDKMAHEGCYFKTAWASTVCMPTRAMLMSGRYAHLTKWWDNGQMGKKPKGGILTVPESSPFMIGQVAKKAGYQSIWVGKTHCTSGSNYPKFGFDECVFSPGEHGVRGTSPEHFRNVKNKKFWNYDSFLWWPEVQLINHPDHEGEDLAWAESEINTFGPDIETECIFNFMERMHNEDEPFFVYHTSHLGHQAIDMASPKFKMTWPGTPKVIWDAKTETYTRLDPKITPNGPVNTVGTTYKKENITPNGINHHVEYLDYQLWQYLQKLEEMDELENTIILFMADNGSNGGWKASVVRQRGMHVPLVAYAPGQKQFVKGEQDVISDLTDILPTLADIMGVELPSNEEYELSGTSFWPYLTKESDHHRDWIYAFKGPSQMVRGHDLLRDGNGDWWDVRKTPADLDNFPKITDFSKLTEEQQKEKVMIDEVMERYAREDIGGPHSFHADPSRKLSDAEIEKMRLKAEHLKEHLKQFK